MLHDNGLQMRIHIKILWFNLQHRHFPWAATWHDRRLTATKSTYTKQGEFFPDFSILWIEPVSSSLSATDNQILTREAATRYFPRYLTYCFVCSSVVGNGKGSRESNWRGALRIHLFPPVLSPSLQAFVLIIYRNNKPTVSTVVFPNTTRYEKVINYVRLLVERCNWLPWW